MSDPVTAGISAGGSLIGGMGNMASALSGSGGIAPQIDPEVAAYLQQQGIDLSAANQYFGQEMQQQTPEYMKALQDSYTQKYGGTEQGALDYAESALSGGETPLTKNMLSAYGAQLGGQREAMMGQIQQQMAQAGIDPSSPQGQAMLQQGQQQLASTYAQGSAGIRNTQAQQGLQNALEIWKQGQSTGRIAGMQTPDVPQTALEKQQADYWKSQGYGGWDKNKPFQSALSAMGAAGKAAFGGGQGPPSGFGIQSPETRYGPNYAFPTGSGTPNSKNARSTLATGPYKDPYMNQQYQENQRGKGVSYT
jgi:hypothetical protein